MWEEVGFDDVVKVEQKKEEIEKEIKNLESTYDKKTTESTQLDELISQKKDELIVVNDELLYQSFGFYDTKYDLESSQAYKEKLDNVRERQKSMAKNKTATIYPENFTLDGDKKKGKQMVTNIVKMTLRSFNNECDTVISKVKFNNIESSEKRIMKSHEQLNKFNSNNTVSIKVEYLNLKLEELYLAYEYTKKIEEEKEEQRQIKEQMREEAKIQKEIEEQKKKLEKDEKHFNQALQSYRDRVEKADEKMKEELKRKIQEYEEKLSDLQKEKEQVDFREQNARAGYVYIISNIGSLGEDIVKIGMTRRLEPLDRVKELGNASIPFTFDIHGMIFSNDAPTLETKLHQAFDHLRVNKVNNKKEFFRVGLSDVEREVMKNHDATLELTKVAEAEEYRQSKAIESQLTSNEYTPKEAVETA
ncbi:DUF4041 domain-containing protein [Virgibacillus sp. C22-A2]|uniref:DUF4041 domain-containing protein n=2 Tax=Virgibacillus tibetensis TaxID=3042313 RepID=A0ABU6KKA2_9BACI|nr:DUF4041 domain-containing protein [Virgibacillus sp. C22-A2]